MRIVTLVFALTMFSSSAVAEDMTQKCASHPGLLRNEAGSLVWFSSSQLHSMAVKQVVPEPVHIRGLIFEGVVKIKIMVNTSGEVICMWDVSGHPLMLANAVKAAHDWKFKPKIENGKPTEFVGILELPVFANGDGN